MKQTQCRWSPHPTLREMKERRIHRWQRFVASCNGGSTRVLLPAPASMLHSVPDEGKYIVLLPFVLLQQKNSINLFSHREDVASYNFSEDLKGNWWTVGKQKEQQSNSVSVSMAFPWEGFLRLEEFHFWNASCTDVTPLNIDDVHQVEGFTLEVYKHICVAAAFSFDLKASPGRHLQW